jgi:hypothetical protein
MIGRRTLANVPIDAGALAVGRRSGAQTPDA